MTSGATRQLAVTVGQNIKAARGEAGLNQRQLASALGVGEMMVSKWERGKHRPSAAYEVKLADVLFGGDTTRLYVVSNDNDQPEAA